VSVRALSWALDAPIDSHGAKLLLVAIANYADDKGRSWPGQDTLAGHVRADRKSIIRWISKLEADGYIQRERRGGDGTGRRSNLYQLALDAPGNRTSTSGCLTGQSPTEATLQGGQCPTGDTLGKVPLVTQAKSQPDPGNVPLVTHEPSEEPLEKKKRGEARASDAPSPPTEKTKRATRFDLATIPDDWRDWCASARPDLDPGETFADFADYWRAKPGKEGLKLDWLATWRRWVRNQHARPAAGSQRSGGPTMRRADGYILTDAEIARQARPGETWDQVRVRLLRARP
jgi:hypothetical protein